MSGPSTPAPTPYQPTGQSTADSAYSNLAQNMQQAGNSLYQNTVPALDAQTAATLNNPYAQTAMNGVLSTADRASNDVAPHDYTMAMSDYNLGNQAATAAPGVLQQGIANANQAWNTAMSAIPQATGGYQLAPQVYNQIMSQIPAATQGFQLGPQMLAQAQSAIPAATQGYQLAPAQLMAMMSMLPQATAQMPYAAQTLQTGYDPQNALYSQQAQQLEDQTNAINAESGLAGSPFGAGVTGQNLNNFNVNWQNNLLSRQVAALGAYDSASSAATGNFTNLMNSGIGNYNSLVNGATNNLATLQGLGVNDYNSLVNGAAGNLANLTNSAVGDYNSLTGQATSNLTGLLNSGSSDYSSLMNSGISGFNTLSGDASSLFNGSSNLMNADLSAMTLGAQLPYDMSQSINENNMQAIAQQIAGTNAAMAPWQQTIGDQGTYLGIGQNATSGSLAAWQATQAANQANMSGLGSLFGAGADMLGLGNGGLGAMIGL